MGKSMLALTGVLVAMALSTAANASKTCMDFSGEYYQPITPKRFIAIKPGSCDVLTAAEWIDGQEATETTIQIGVEVTFETETKVQTSLYRWDDLGLQYEIRATMKNDGHLYVTRGKWSLDQAGSLLVDEYYLDSGTTLVAHYHSEWYPTQLQTN